MREHMIFVLGAVSLALLLECPQVAAVKEIRNMKDYNDVFAASGGARPVILDFFSQSCGPCHMIAPTFNQLARKYGKQAFFRKIDVNRAYDVAAKSEARGVPTFQFWYRGKKVQQFSGADEQGLRNTVQRLVDQADREDILVSAEDLLAFYQKHDPAKATEDNIKMVLDKNKDNLFKMVTLLQKKYKDKPTFTQKPLPTGPAPGAAAADGEAKAAGGLTVAQALEKATPEEFEEENEKRKDEALTKEQAIEEEKILRNSCLRVRRAKTKAHRKDGLLYSEKVVIVGGGPAGLSAAIYAARAGLCPIVIAPAQGGQLRAKGVDVENYPGVSRLMGGAIVDAMVGQARLMGAEMFEDNMLAANLSTRPFVLTLNGTLPSDSEAEREDRIIRTHTLIVATGADSRWLGVEGEWELRGAGLSSCATCDGYLYKGKRCVVIGGGDTATEEALYLSNICKSTVVIHRRDSFRASNIMSKRILENPRITVMWNTMVKKFQGDPETGLKSVLVHRDGKDEEVETDGAFVAIGHDPNTQLFRDQLEMNKVGYLALKCSGSQPCTHTTVDGVFAAGDVADHTYRQAVTSAGTGAMSALDAERWLSTHGAAVCDFSDAVDMNAPLDYATWTVKELRAELKDRELDCTGCAEKSDFVQALQEAAGTASV